MIRHLLIGRLYLSFPLIGLCIGCAILNPPDDTPYRKELSDLVITEIHYNPLPENSLLGDEFEFVELYNRGDKEISLKQVAISDGIEYQFNNSATIKPGEYIVLASNEDEFKNRYGFDPYGYYTGNLKDSGERIALEDLDVQREFFVIEYDDQSPWPSVADGEGYSMVSKSTDAQVDLTSSSQWRASFELNGSPGNSDPGPVYINEIMPHTDPPDEDAIELYNPNSTPVDISEWYLTDSKDEPNKFCIPKGTVIEAGGYLVFYSHDFNDVTLQNPFNLSENGEEVYLFANASIGGSNRYSHGFSFDALENSSTFGRYINSSGEERFVTFDKSTLGATNTGPITSQVVITEIMYNPQNGRDEYIEIKNISTQTIPLFDPDYPINTWKISGFDFIFPSNVSLKSGELAVITTDTIPVEEFRSLYNVPSGVKIFNSAQGGLRNSGDTITLLVPLKPNTDIEEVLVPYKVEEYVAYGDEKLWPVSADGNGSALIRRQPDQFADDPNNWMAGSPSPGRDAP